MCTNDFGNPRYSFDYGLVKTKVLSFNRFKTRIEPTHIDRSRTPWLVVMMHTQFYTTFKAHNDEQESVAMRHLNFVISGHDHAYRTKPMFQGKVDKSGKSPTYNMTVGEGGNREDHVKNYIHADPEDWVGARDKSKCVRFSYHEICE